MEYMTPQDWKEFRDRYPAAVNFLTSRDLQREYEYLLKNEANGYKSLDSSRVRWMKSRLNDLRYFRDPERYDPTLNQAATN
jgi:tryptophan 2,3-dioxygenase